MFKLDLEKAAGADIKLPTSVGSSKKQENSRNTSTSALLTMPRLLTVEHNKLWEIPKEMGIPDHLTCFLRICMQVKKQLLDWTWNNGLVPNWERSKSRLYIITLPI